MDCATVEEQIKQHISGPGSSQGYRSMWHSLRLDGIEVPRGVVQYLLKEIDPEWTEDRKGRRLKRRQYRNPWTKLLMAYRWLR